MPTLRIAVDARRARDEYGRFIKSSKDAEVATSQLDKNVRGLERTLSSSAGTMGRVKTMIGGLFAGFAAAQQVRYAVSTMASFEQTMSTVQAVTRATPEQFALMSKTARDMGATTKFSASEAAEGLVYLTRAGQSATEASISLAPSLRLAQAGGIGLAESADIVSKSLAQFGLGADQASKIADVFTTTSNRSNTNVLLLGESMKFAGPMAKAFNKDIEEVSAAMGVLGDSGIQGAMGGTAVRQMLASLADPTKEARDAIKSMKIEMKDLNPSTHSLTEIFGRLRAANMGANEALAIFSTRQGSAALALSNGVEKLKELTAANRESAGAAAEAAKIMDNNLAGAWKSFISALEEAQLQVGDSGVLGALRSTVDMATNVIRVFAGMADTIGENRAQAEQLAKVIETVGAVVATLIGLKAIAAFVSLSQVILGVNVSLKAMIALLAANPFTLIAVAISAAVAALVYFKDETVTIGNQTAALGDFVRATWEAIKVAVIELWNSTVTFVTDRLKEAWDYFEEATSGIFDSFKSLTSSMDTTWDDVWGVMLEATKAVVNVIIGIIMTIADAFDAVLSRMKEFYGAFAKISFDSWEGFKSSLGDVADVWRNMDSLTTTIEKFGTNVEDNFKRDWLGDISKMLSAESSGGASGPSFVEKVSKAFQSSLDASRAARDQAALAAPTVISTKPSFDPNALQAELAGLGQGPDLQQRELMAQVDAMFEALKQERAAIGMTNAERQIYLDKQKLLSLGRAAEIADIDSLAQKYEVEARSINAANEAHDARSKINDIFADLDRQKRLQEYLQKEGDLLKENNEERKLRIELFELEELATKAGEQDIQGLLSKYESERRALMARSDAAKTTVVNMAGIAQDVGSAFGSFFTDIVTGAKTAEQAFIDLGNTIVNAVINQLIAIPVATAISSAIAAPFGGLVRPYATGGVVDSPTPFFSGQGRGIAGEAGPEAILPLSRGTDGVLGVSAPQAMQPIVINQKISTPDASSFMLSKRQVVSGLRRAIGGR